MSKSKAFTLTASDFKWDYFRAGGKGGQNQNKRDTGVRCSHIASGAVGEARDNRTQGANKKAAFRRMAESDEFQTWARITALKLRPVEEIVDEMMKEEDLIIEYL